MRESGKCAVHVTCDKGICRTMNVSLLAHNRLYKSFKSWNFTINPYDPCIWNEMELLTQITIMFHIDDLIMSNESVTIVTKHVKLLDASCGEKDPLTETRGKTHDCLGTTIDFSLK